MLPEFSGPLLGFSAVMVCGFSSELHALLWIQACSNPKSIATQQTSAPTGSSPFS
jgi:hypothetical protein